MATKRPGAYTPLAANYADDDAIMRAGEDAELMYVRMLAYCGRTPKTEGWISDKQIRTRLGLETRPEIGPETAPEKRAERLAEVGLIVREGEGYRIKSWLKWNRSAEEMGRAQAQDRERKNGVTSTDTGKGTGNGSRKKPRNPPPVPDGSTETETETETDGGRARPKRATQLPDDWQPTASHKEQAQELRVDLDREADKFRDHARANGRTGKDWDAAFRNWLRKAAEFTSNVRQLPGQTPQDPDENAWMRRRLPGPLEYDA